MKKLIKLITILSTIALFASCQFEQESAEDILKNASSGSTTETSQDELTKEYLKEHEEWLEKCRPFQFCRDYVKNFYYCSYLYDNCRYTDLTLYIKSDKIPLRIFNVEDLRNSEDYEFYMQFERSDLKLSTYELDEANFIPICVEVWRSEGKRPVTYLEPAHIESIKKYLEENKDKIDWKTPSFWKDC